MKAIILASGIGKRLKPLTNNLPKSLIKLNDKTIVEKQIDALVKNNIRDIIVTTGPFEEKMISFIKEKYKEINLMFVNNPQYDTTNYIYSLWLTKDYITDDIILLHGDLFFDEKLLLKMLKIEGNVVLVNKEVKKPKKDFKAVIENKLVKKIGVEYFSENAFFSLPLYKFSKKDFLIWIDAIEKEIKNKNLNIYAEEAFNKISDKINLKPLFFSKETCMEIDTKEDLDEIKRLIHNY
jgi:phosphoenolpyruvate phosphomutase